METKLRLNELRSTSMLLIRRLDEIAAKRQGMLDDIWLLEHKTTDLRKDLLRCVNEVEEIIKSETHEF